MTIPPFLDWGGQRFGITRESLHVHMTNGTADPASTIITDEHGHQANVQLIASDMDGNEYGLITNSVIHGLSTAGGGAWVDVKVNPSGALTVESTIAGIDTGVIIPTTRADDFYNDAFQRLRVSNTDQRFDSEFIYDKNPILFDEIVAGAGTVTYNANSRDLTLAIGGTAITDAAGMYQHFYNPYTPGNSQFIAMTGMLNGANAAGTASVFLRTDVTGSVETEVVNQSAWTGGTAGINWQYSQIFLMDFQSLKVGRIRFALDMGGIAVPVASIENDNEKAGGYWQFANAPVFWRTYNTATTTVTEIGYGDTDNAVGFRYTTALNASQTMRAICATVKSEGGGDLLNMSGLPFTASNGASTKTVSTTLIPILSVQLKTTFGAGANRALVVPTDLSLINDNPIYWEVRVNPTLTGGSFASVDANSICNFDTAGTAVSGGRVIASGYSGAAAQGRQATTSNLTGKIPLSVNYAGTTGDIVTICAIRVGTTNSATGAALSWKEIR